MSRKLPKNLSEEEFVLLVKNTLKKHHRVAWLLAYESGLRVSEVIFLKPEDIDLKGRKILIKDSKYGRDRVVPLAKSFRPKMMAQIPLKCKIRALQDSFKRAIQRANLRPELSVHSLRHSFALRCLEKGVPINQVQLLLGHSNISTTSVYLRANPKDALSSYEKFF